MMGMVVLLLLVLFVLLFFPVSFAPVPDGHQILSEHSANYGKNRRIVDPPESIFLFRIFCQICLKFGHGAEDEAREGGKNKRDGNQCEQFGDKRRGGILHHVPNHLAQFTATADLQQF
jgi:hypothetical protein